MKTQKCDDYWLNFSLMLICTCWLLTCSVHIISVDKYFVYGTLHFPPLTFCTCRQNRQMHTPCDNSGLHILLQVFSIGLTVPSFIVPISKCAPLGFILMMQNWFKIELQLYNAEYQMNRNNLRNYIIPQYCKNCYKKNSFDS